MSDEVPVGMLEILDLQKVGEGVFLGRPSDDGRSRVFGGHTIAQALAAACFSVDGWAVHSLHAYFIRPGLPGRPTEYEVSAIRDGQSFAVRQVVGIQRDEVVFQLTASFSADEGDGGPQHQVAMPDVAPPDSYPSEEERTAKMLALAPPALHDMIRRKRPMEAIRTELFDAGVDLRSPTRPSRVWMRARDVLGSDPNLHRCCVAYASDAGALEPGIRASGSSLADPRLAAASLDHSLWFHRPLRFDEWLLFSFEAISASGNRAMCRGTVHDTQGRLVASLAQEGLVRVRGEGG